jgi:hypothetical protein
MANGPLIGLAGVIAGSGFYELVKLGHRVANGSRVTASILKINRKTASSQVNTALSSYSEKQRTTEIPLRKGM